MTSIPELRCALCGGAIAAHENYFRATGQFLPAKDPLTTYCGAPLHWHCYAQWPERPRFARRYVEAWQAANRKNPFWWSVYADEQVYVSVNPERPVEEVSIRLYEVGSDIRVPLRRWSEWLENADLVTPNLQPVERQALRAVLPTLRQRFPDDRSVVFAIDEDEKTSRRRG